MIFYCQILPDLVTKLLNLVTLGQAAEEQPQADQPPCVDLTEFPLKIDHFENMHVLDPKDEIKGGPNFRKVKNATVLLRLAAKVW